MIFMYKSITYTTQIMTFTIQDFENDKTINKLYNSLKNNQKIPKRVHQKKNVVEKKETERNRKKMFHLIRRKMNQRTITKVEDYNYV